MDPGKDATLDPVVITWVKPNTIATDGLSYSNISCYFTPNISPDLSHYVIHEVTPSDTISIKIVVPTKLWDRDAT